MSGLVARLDQALRTAGLSSLVGVSVPDPANRATWKVQPTALQASAQPTIDTFNPDDQAVIDADVAAAAAATVAQKDLIATIALIASQTDANWGTKTVPQKVAAVQALMTTWRTLRAFVEKNL